MTPRPLNECTALITGSSAGIGWEIAAQLAEAGVPRVMVNGRNAERVEAAVARLRERVPGTRFQGVNADATKPADARKAVDETLAAFGAIDILVNSIPSPSQHSPRPFHQAEPAEIDAQIAAHMMSVIYTCNAAMAHMIERKNGVIVNIASDAGKIATPGESVIGAGKAGTIMFSRGMALEQSRHGIRVNVVTPSIVAGTDGYNRVMAQEFSRKVFQKAESKARLGVVTPADIAPLVVFLASPAASKLTGQAISVNGGISAA